MTPLDWRGLVDEALRRRKAEGLTQKEHAALAGVSVPTMVAFDRAETTLSLGKAFDILSVVGLIAKPAPEGSQAQFVQAAMERWRALVDKLPTGSPARFEHGWFRIDYFLEGDLKTLDVDELPMLVENAKLLTGWPMFMHIHRPEFEPREVDGVLECWLRPDRDLRTLNVDPAHCDFWRAAPEGRFLLMRGYQEDGAETFDPGRIFDTTLPIWRLGEALLHAARMASAMGRDGASGVTVHFRATYTGLAGRILKDWANPLSDLGIEGHAALGDEAVLETETPAEGLDGRLASVLFPLVAKLYGRFGIPSLSETRVAAELPRMQRTAR